MVGLVVSFRARRFVVAGTTVPLVAGILPRDVTKLDDGG
jgi:hypothetical protein